MTAWLRELRPREPFLPVMPACSASLIDGVTKLVGLQAVHWALQKAEKVVTEIHQKANNGLPVGLHEVIRGDVQSRSLWILRALHLGLGPSEVGLTTEMAQSARCAAQHDVPVSDLIRGIYTTIAHLHQGFVYALRTDAADNDFHAEARNITVSLYAYADRFAEDMAAVFATERAQWTGNPAAVRLRLARALLDDPCNGTPEAERTLGLPLEAYHQAFIVWADNRTTPASEVSRFATALAGSLNTRTLVLNLAEPQFTAWVWGSWPERPDRPIVPVLRDSLHPIKGIKVVAGPIAHGAAGFRRSHRDAASGIRLSAANPASWIADYPDFVIPALLTADDEHARRFAAETLGKLAEDSPKAAVLRETLHRYLLSGRSRTKAANELHLAPNTVAYRVKQAESLLGTPPEDNTLKVLLALEVFRAIGAEGR